MRAHEILEVEWAEFNDLDPAGMVCCSSGTAALHLALEAVRLPQGSSVIVPDYAMIACARAVTLAGLAPVFVDCRPDDLLMDTSACAGWVEIPGLRAVMAVHVYGRRCDMGAVHDLFSLGGYPALRVVEDLAEAHGVQPHPHTDAACWSFYRNKIVAGEEGGAVWFRDRDHARLARQLRNVGFTDAHDYTHVRRGHNYRLSDLHASYILADHPPCSVNGLAYYRQNVRMRREVESAYDDACPVEWRMPHRDAPWVYDLRIPGLRGWLQNEIVADLRQRGVEARHGFKPLSSQEEYYSIRTVHGKWQALAAAQEVVCLPLTRDMGDRAAEVFSVVARHVDRAAPGAAQ